MLTESILPSPNLDPAAAVAWLLQNPLLKAAYGTKLTRRAEQVAAGQYQGPALHKLAVDLYCERNRLHLSLAGEPEDQAAEQELRGLLHARTLTEAERKDLSYRLHTSRPSEYAWLRAPIAAVIQARAEAVLSRVAAQVSRANNLPILRASQLAA